MPAGTGYMRGKTLKTQNSSQTAAKTKPSKMYLEKAGKAGIRQKKRPGFRQFLKKNGSASGLQPYYLLHSQLQCACIYLTIF